MVNWLNRQFIPNRIIAIIENDLQLEELQKYLFFKGKNSDKGKKINLNSHLSVETIHARFLFTL